MSTNGFTAKSNQDIDTDKPIYGRKEIDELDLNDPNIIDSFDLDKRDKKKGFWQFLIFTLFAVFIFFIPVNVDGSSNIVFGVIYTSIINFLGNFGLWLVAAVIAGNGVVSVYGKFFSKPGTKLHEYYEKDSPIHILLYIAAGVFIVMYSLSVTTGFQGPELIVGAATGGTVIPDVVLGVAWIIPVGAFFVPFLLDYGSIDFVGILFEPIMRPVFKVPGKSAIDAIASFVGSSSMAVIITSRLYKSNVYTKKEAAIIATSFSAVSIGYAALVVKTAGLMDHFLKIYFSAFFLTFLVTFFMVRIPPLKNKESVYYNGRVQNKEELKKESSYDLGMFKRGVDRASKKAYASGNPIIKIKDSLIDGGIVVPKVISLLCSIGIIGMIVAKFTPFFDYVGMVFLPLMKLLQVPQAEIIAGPIMAGITEMFLPVLIIADKVDILSEGARYFTIAVSMVQIIFFAETVVVMVTTGIPVKIKELAICFLLRTIIAMPFAALFMHLMF